jgi:transposase
LRLRGTWVAFRNRPPLIGPAQAAALQAQLDAYPEATLTQHAARWEAEHGVRVSMATLHRVIRTLGLTIATSKRF